jgi:acetylcholinesterase
MDELLQLYPQDPTQGSPYDTGTQNTLTPEFKRMASILGDLVFQAPRRFFLNTVSDEQKTWSYCMSHLPFLAYPCRSHCHTVSKRLDLLPILGSVHASDLPNIYGGGDLTEFLIQFVTNLDPNSGSSQWPQYTISSPQLMTLLGNQLTSDNKTITLDTYRDEGIQFITNLSLIYQQ